MTDTQNVSMTADKIIVKIGDQTIEVKTELLAGYKDEAFERLGEIEEQKSCLKEIVEAAAKGTGLPKGLINKYFKAKFKDQTKEAKQTGDVFATLDEGLEG